MTRVLVLGQQFTGARIAVALNAAGGAVDATFVPQGDYLRLLAGPPRAASLVLMRVGYRVGSGSPRGRAFDAYWSVLRRRLPRAVGCHYWIGSDVLDTIEAARAGTLRRAPFARARDDLHLSVAPWLTSELATVGLEATTALLPAATRMPAVAPAMPAEFRVLSYLPAARFAFYGGPLILAAARLLPDTGFDVVGPGDPPEAVPPNVRWHGWVGDMSARYGQVSVVVRLPRHDGFGNTVIEGLLNARHVVYTHEVPHVRRLPAMTPEALVEVLQELREAHAAGTLAANDAGRTYALATFDEARLVADLVELLRGAARGG
jgi:hypothetical protein